MKTNRLMELFMHLQKDCKCVRFGDLMRAGYNSFIIEIVVKQTGAAYEQDEEGYTIVGFKKGETK